MITANSRVYDCPATWYNGQHYCVDCGAPLCSRQGVKRCRSCANKQRMTTGLADNRLTRGMCADLSIPRRMCPSWGTPACARCEYKIPPWCPALDGQPDMSCDKCTMICRCNGRLAESQAVTESVTNDD